MRHCPAPPELQRYLELLEGDPTDAAAEFYGEDGVEGLG